MTALCIWWLSRGECEAIGETLPERFPEYLRRKYRYLAGHPGFTRLWIDERFVGQAAPLTPARDIALGIWVSQCTGIVMRAEDVCLLGNLPGLVTDHNGARKS
jgi:hypothetical protein